MKRHSVFMRVTLLDSNCPGHNGFPSIRLRDRDVYRIGSKLDNRLCSVSVETQYVRCRYKNALRAWIGSIESGYQRNTRTWGEKDKIWSGAFKLNEGKQELMTGATNINHGRRDGMGDGIPKSKSKLR